MRNLICGLAIVLTLSASPLFRAGAEPAGKRIAHLTPSLADAFMSQMARSLTMRSELLGMSVTTFSGGGDATRRSGQLDEAIGQRYDMIALVGGPREATRDLLRRAKAAGIPVVLMSTPPEPGAEDQFLTAIGEDRRELGRLAGRALLDALQRSGRDRGNVAVIAGPLGETEAALRLEGFEQAIAAAQGVNIVAVEDVGWKSAAAAKAATRLIARYRPAGRLDAIYAMADDQAAAVIEAAESAGLATGGGGDGLIVLASGCMRTGIVSIRAGKQHSTGTKIPARTGWLAAELIADHFKGAALPKRRILPVATIDRDNVAMWEAACSF